MEYFIRVVELAAAVAGLCAFLDALLVRWKENQKLAKIELIVAAILTVGVLIAYLLPIILHVKSETINCSNRPCVFDEAFRFTNDYRVIEMGVRNSGGAPALNVTSRTLVLSVERNDDVQTDLNMITEEILPPPKSSGTLSPGSSATFRLAISESTPSDQASALVSGIKTGVRRLYVVGQIEFDDEFGGHHFPRFCMEWSGRAFTWCPEIAFVKGQKP